MNSLLSEPFLKRLDLRKIDAALAEVSLMDFIRQAWPIVEPGSPFVSGKHIEAIALHLEAVTRGDICNLVVNIPPRFAKSLLVCVFWPTWVWARHPQSRWLFASYAQTLSVRDSLKCRRIIESPWYQANWGGRFQLTSDQNTKARFENDKTGFRLSTSVEGTATGEGGDIIVVDDPHNVSEALSAARLEAVTRWYDEVWSTRLNNPKTGRKVVIMQRVSEKDLSAHLLAKGDYEHLCLPMEFESGRRCTTSIGWKDWRSEDGQLLWPERIGPDGLERLKRSLGSYGAAGQLQQRPAPRGGGLFQRQWFEVVGAAPATGQRIRYWDRAATENTGTNDPDWTVGVKLLRDEAGLFYVEDIIRLQGSPLRVEQAIRNTATLDGYDVRIGLEQDPGQAGAAEANYLIRQLAGYCANAFLVTRDKVTRATPASCQAEAGNVKLVRGRWNEAFLSEIEVFPAGSHDDQIDAFSGAFNALSEVQQVFLA